MHEKCIHAWQEWENTARHVYCCTRGHYKDAHGDFIITKRNLVLSSLLNRPKRKKNRARKTTVKVSTCSGAHVNLPFQEWAL